MRLEMMWAVLLLAALTVPSSEALRVGLGRADMTGPIADVAFMGYAHPNQRGEGLHLRQFSRAFIIDDGENRLVYVTNDCGMMGTGVRHEVLKGLKEKFGDLYTEKNVMLSGTHTHSTPGGFLMDIIFDLNTFGFVKQTFQAYVLGIIKSITKAHENLQEGKIVLTTGEVLDANINRSPTAYLYNPAEERAKYEYDVDKTLVQLKFLGLDGKALGALTWFAVHATSMNNTNTLVSSDNVGLAAILFETKMDPKSVPGQSEFVAGFGSSNLGDVSPNTKGPRCVPSGAPCHPETSTCALLTDQCIASGPGNDMFDSTYIIANKILNEALAAWDRDGENLDGKVRSVHQFVHMPSQNITVQDPATGENTTLRGCKPAMGYSFAAGTTDGPGAFPFKQGTKTTNPLWNALSYLIAAPSAEQAACHAPKPILLSTGEMNFPYEWQPHIVSTQLGIIGGFGIACVPGEFTTMSGRRLRQALSQALAANHVVLAGLCNTYSDYITTPEEYQAQRYEGASTIFGPHTLPIYIEQYKNLADHIMKETEPKAGPSPNVDFSSLVSLLPGVIFDFAGFGRYFGQVLSQPAETVEPGQTVSALFVAGNPRNELKQESTFLVVERQRDEDHWDLVATDAHWETKFKWTRTSTVLGTSTAEVFWTVPRNVLPGVYRVRHFGNFKYVNGNIGSYVGVSNNFQVINTGS